MRNPGWASLLRPPCPCQGLGISVALRHKQPTLVSMSRCVDVWGGFWTRHGGSCPQYRVEGELVLWEFTPCCQAGECLDLLRPWHKYED